MMQAVHGNRGALEWDSSFDFFSIRLRSHEHVAVGFWGLLDTFVFVVN